MLPYNSKYWNTMFNCSRFTHAYWWKFLPKVSYPDPVDYTVVCWILLFWESANGGGELSIITKWHQYNAVKISNFQLNFFNLQNWLKSGKFFYIYRRPKVWFLKNFFTSGMFYLNRFRMDLIKSIFGLHGSWISRTWIQIKIC